MQLTGYQDLKYVDPPRTTIDRPVTAEEAEKPCGYDGPMQTIQLCFSWVLLLGLRAALTRVVHSSWNYPLDSYSCTPSFPREGLFFVPDRRENPFVPALR